MDDAISTLQLGVGTNTALTHLQLLRAEFKALKEDMLEFSKIGSSSDALKAHTASAASALEQMTVELRKSQNEVAALKSQMQQLSNVEVQLANRGIQTYVKAEEEKTKVKKEGAKARAKIAEEEAADAIKYSQGQSVRVGGTSFSMRTGSDQTEFDAAKKAAETEKQIVEAHIDALKEKAIRENQQFQGFKLRQAEIISEAKKTERDIAQAHSDALKEKAARENQQFQGFKMRQAEALSEAKKADRELANAHAEALKEKAARENQQFQGFKMRQAETLSETKRADRELASAHAEALKEKAARENQDLLAHNQRVAEALAVEKAARREAILNNNFNTGSLKSQIGTATKAKGLVRGGDQDLALELYGADAVASVGRLGDMHARLASTTKASGNAAKEATGHMKEHAASLRDAHSAARGVAGGFQAMWLTWGNIVPLMAGFALSTALREAAKGFIDVQYQMTFVNSLSGDTRTSVEDLSHSLHKVSADLGMMPQDAGKGLRSLAQAGLDAQESMFALPIAFKMATVGEMQLGDAATSLTGIMNAFGKSVGQVESISDTLVKAAASSNASVSSITEAMKVAAPTAKQFNVTLEETAMILTAMAKSNITGTAAGTAAKNMIKEMAAPTTQAVRDMMKDILGGFSAFNADGFLKPITQQVEELKAQLKGFDRESQAAILVRMFGERGDKAFFSLLKMTKEEINGMLTDVSDSAGKTSQVFFDLQRTVKGQWQMMVAEVKGSLGEIGSNGEHAMVDIMREIRRIFADDDVKSNLIGLTQSVAALGEVSVKYGPQILAAFAIWKTSGVMAAGIAGIRGALVTMGVAFSGATGAATALGVAMNAIPWVRILSLVGSLAAGYLLLRERKESLAEKTMKELSDLGSIADAMKKENDELEKRNNLRAQGIKLAELESRVQLDDARSKVATLEGELAKYDKTIADDKAERQRRGAASPMVIQVSPMAVEAAQLSKKIRGELEAARANLALIDAEAARKSRLRVESTLYDKHDTLEQKGHEMWNQPAGAKHYIPSEQDNARGAAALAKAENNAILEEYRHAEKMAKDRYASDIKLADAYYKEGLSKTNEYLTARDTAQSTYEKSQKTAADVARNAISKIDTPAKRQDLTKQFETDLEKIHNKSLEQKQQDALNESLRLELELIKEKGAARKYAQETLPAIDDAQKRKQANELEAYSLKLMTVEEQNILKARRDSAEDYKRSADEIRQRLALADEEIAKNQAVLNSKLQVDDEWLRADEAVRIATERRKALQGSLDLNAAASSKGQDDATAIAKKVNEQNKWNVALQRSTDIAKKMEDAFGKVGKSVGGLTTAFVKYSKGQDDIQKRLDVRIANAKDSTEVEHAAMEAKKEYATAEVGYYADVTGAAKGFFSEHSKGYEIMQAAERTFRAFEMAMQMESFLQKTGLLTAFTGLFAASKVQEVTLEQATVAPKLAAEGAKQGANGITALTEALKLPFPANIPAFALVGAMLASIGVAVAGGGGGGQSIDIAKERQKYNGTGQTKDTAHDWELEKSKSINGSLEFLKDNSDIALTHSSGMLDALKSIKNGIAGMATFVTQTTGLRGTKADEQRFGVGVKKGALGFSKTSTELLDSGLFFAGGQTVGSVMNSGINANSYADLKTSKSSFWGLRSSSNTNTEFGDIDNSLKEQLALTVKSINAGVLEAADALGAGGNDLANRLRSFGLNIDRISLKGLSSEAIGEELQAAFGRLGDDMAKSAVGGLNQFQRVGEGYFETLVRVAAGVESAQYELEQLGIAAVAYASVADKQGDVNAEIIRDSLVMKEGASGVSLMIREMNGAAGDIISTYRDLMDVRRKMSASGVDGYFLTRDTVRGAGGLDNLKNGVGSFFDNFLTEEERLASKTAELQAEFTRLGVAFPTSKAGFKDLIGGLDLTSVANQKLYGQLIVLSSALNDIADDAGNLNPALTAQLKGINDLIKNAEKWLGISNQAKSLLADIDAEINGTRNNASRITDLWAMMSASISPEQQLELAGELKDLILERYQVERDNAQNLIDLGKSLQQYVKDLRISDLSPLTMGEKLATATSEYQITLAKARSGDSEAVGQLQSKADDYLNLAREFYASSTAYTDIFNAVTGNLDAVGASSQVNGQTQLQVSASQLSELQQLRGTVSELAQYANTQYMDQIDKLSQSLTALNGMYERLGVLSTVPDILLGLPAEIAASLSGRIGGTVVNGSHAGGLTYVPFDGYMAELHRGERVLTASESKEYNGDASGDRAALVAEIRALREEVAALRREQHQQTGDLIRVQYDSTERAAEKVVDGQHEAADNLAWKDKSEAKLV